MESQNIEFRAVIKLLTRKNIHQHMIDVYGDSSPPKVFHSDKVVSRKKKRGRDPLENGPRPGRPADSICQEMIYCAKQSPNQSC